MQFLSMFLRVETEITLSPGNRVILSYSAVSRPLRKQAPNPLFRSWWMVRTTGHCALISSMSAAVPSVLPSLTMMISIVTFPAALQVLLLVERGHDYRDAGDVRVGNLHVVGKRAHVL